MDWNWADFWGKNMKLFIISFMLLATPVMAQDLVIPHQSKEITDYYRSERYDDIRVELKLEHSYIRQDKVFLLPCDYYGQSEYYDLGFYVDMDLRIKDNISANDYRILYKNNRDLNNRNKIIPEPISLLSFLCLNIFIFRAKKGKLPTIRNNSL